MATESASAGPQRQRSAPKAVHGPKGSKSSAPTQAICSVAAEAAHEPAWCTCKKGRTARAHTCNICILTHAHTCNIYILTHAHTHTHTWYFIRNHLLFLVTNSSTMCSTLNSPCTSGAASPMPAMSSNCTPPSALSMSGAGYAVPAMNSFCRPLHSALSAPPAANPLPARRSICRGPPPSGARQEGQARTRCAFKVPSPVLCLKTAWTASDPRLCFAKGCKACAHTHTHTHTHRGAAASSSGSQSAAVRSQGFTRAGRFGPRLQALA